MALKTRVCAVSVLAAYQVCAAQIAGSLTMDRTKFLLGEPIPVRYEVRNAGTKSKDIAITQLYGDCGSTFQGWISDGQSVKRRLTRDIDIGRHEWILSCSWTSVTLDPNESYRRSFILNEEYEQLRALRAPGHKIHSR